MRLGSWRLACATGIWVTLALGGLGAAAASGRARFIARGSVQQVYATGLKARHATSLLDSAGGVIARRRAGRHPGGQRMSRREARSQLRVARRLGAVGTTDRAARSFRAPERPAI